MNTNFDRPLLILDLDETLIHGAASVLHRPADFRIGPYHIYKRPHLDTFLSTVGQLYDLAIWSSASADYVEGIAQVLSSVVGEWQFVWSRERCVTRMHPESLEQCILKDLRKVKRLGYDLNRVLIVDDTRHKVSRNYGNAIYVREFLGTDEDDDLVRLAPFLSRLYCEANFRMLEKRNWRSG
jgi:TFIIF-interacting CTD phosphatase-like protein